MSDEKKGVPYYVVYTGVIAGEMRIGSQKILSPVELDNEKIIRDVAKQIKEQKRLKEVTILNWKRLRK